MSCPAFSLHKAPTGSVSSGLYISTINDPNTAKNFMGFDNSCQISTATLYGDDGLAVAENVFTWAQKTSVNVHGPNANVSGTAYTGCLPLSSMMIDS